MSDRTLVAMRLAGIALTQDSRSCDDEETKINTAARALDDAGGVREAVEAMEWVVHDAFYRAPETFDRDICTRYVVKLQQALAALTGTKEPA